MKRLPLKLPIRRYSMMLSKAVTLLIRAVSIVTCSEVNDALVFYDKQSTN